MAVGAWGIQPSEFWAMTPAEWWRIYECRRPRDTQTDYAGRLREEDCAELYAMLEE